ncbi:MAG: DMT family transporter [Oscillospiraceae bacterium]|nr:DMT family transporter [Oscillospiraceae bacterium]
MEQNSKDMKNQTLLYASALLAAFLWASAFPATRYALDYYSPVSLMVMRFGAASITLGIVGIIRKISLPKVGDIPLFIASGLSGVFLYSYLFNTGSVTVPAGVSSFIIASAPVFTLILTWIFLKETAKPLCLIGIAVSVCGLAAVTLTQITEFSFDFGLFLVILAAVSSGIYSTVMRVLTKKYTALEATTYTILTGTLGTLIFLPNAISEMPASNLTVNLLVVFMGVFPAALAYLAWSFALAKAQKTVHVTVFSYLIPFISAFIAFIWLHETMSLLTLAGGIVIIAGMIMTNYFGRE